MISAGKPTIEIVGWKQNKKKMENIWKFLLNVVY